ncbi:hypothetical protein HMPREF1585_00526 [Gardnerella vaginalis JCP8481B]|nr:hypothetical protein HMPREF1585_00526 [Gardnerella vaginalis JCP8481B]
MRRACAEELVLKSLCWKKFALRSCVKILRYKSLLLSQKIL